MLNKIYALIKENIKEIIIFVAIMILFSIKFPYYIDSPGGTISLKKRFEIEGSNEINGDISLVYVAERRATIPSLILSLFFKDWDIIKIEEVVAENESVDDMKMRGAVTLDQSLNNAIILAFKKAGKEYEIISSKLYITYITSIAKTDLKVGDEIISIDDKKVETKDDIAGLLDNLEVGDKLKIVVRENGKEITKYAEIIEYEGKKKIGIVADTLYDYKLSQDVKYIKNKKEMGSSGGFANALFIYQSLIDEDILKNRKVVGTGTIDADGNVGAIGGVKYKLKAALDDDTDVFFISNDNCEEALEIKKEKKYDLNIVCISNFDDAIAYLEK